MFAGPGMGLRHIQDGSRRYVEEARPSMKQVEIEVIERTKDDGRRLRRVVEILAGGVFSFLEEGGYLKDVGEKGKEVEGERGGCYS